MGVAVLLKLWTRRARTAEILHFLSVGAVLPNFTRPVGGCLTEMRCDRVSLKQQNVRPIAVAASSLSVNKQEYWVCTGIRRYCFGVTTAFIARGLGLGLQAYMSDRKL